MSGEYIPPFRVRFLRGTDGANNQYRGPVGEFTIDLTNWRIRIHDGQTFGGHAIANLNDLEQLVTQLDGLSLADIAGAEDLRTEAQISTLITNAVGALETQLRGEISAASGGSDQDFEVRELTVNSHILPATADLDIGSGTQRFRGIYVDEAYLSTNTLYIGDTPILGTDQDTIMIKADLDQSITVRTEGQGKTTLLSQRGVDVTSTGVNADVNVIASGANSKVRFTADDDVELTGNRVRATGDLVAVDNVQVGKNLTVTGNLTVNGERVVIDTEHVRASDNMIQINYGEVGSGVTAGIAGIEVDRGNMSSYQFVFDETAGLFRVGMVGDLETVATRPWTESGFAAIDHGHEVASSTVSGFMSSEDKAKLNGIETGATADQTKADIDALNINAATVNGFTVGVSVPADAVFTDTAYDDSGLNQQISALDAAKVDKTAIANVDNTADADKPVSAAQQAALDLKVSVSDVVNDLLSTAENKPLSANQGRILKGHVDNLTAVLSSDKPALDTLQEIVDYIEINRESLNSLNIDAIAGLQSVLNSKVDKVSGKGLSANDYTDGEKSKLSGIAAGAQVNVATNLGNNATTSSVTITSSTGDNTTVGSATDTVAGIMGAGDKSKLDGIETGAQRNVATNLSANRNSTTYTVASSTGTNVTLQAASNADAGVMTSADKIKLDSLEGGAEVNTVVSVAGKTGAVTLNKNDVGLNNVNNTSDSAKPVSTAQQTALDLKLAITDVVDGLASTANNRPLSANQGRILKGHIDNINTLLDSDTPALDTLQEIVDYVKINRSELENLDIGAIAGLQTALNSKVDKVAGKDLSSNDYTNAEKSKLGGIQAGAQVNVGTNLAMSGSGNSRSITSSTGNNVSVPVVTTSNAGLMSTGDKNKLNGIAAGAQVNTVNAVAGRTGTVTLTHSDIGGLSDAATTSVAAIRSGTSKANVGLNNVDNTSDAAKPVSSAQQTALNGKVDKVSGKQLSDQNFTSGEKNKLSGIEAGAQKNVALETLLAPLGFSKSGSQWTLDAGTL